MILTNYNNEEIDANRIVYTPSKFAKDSLLYLQETGVLTAQKSYTSTRENLSSYLILIILNGEGSLEYEEKIYQLKQGDCVFLDCTKKYILHSYHKLWTLRWIHFNGYNANDLYGFYRNYHASPILSSCNVRDYDLLLRKIYATSLEESTIRDLEIYHYLTELTTSMIKESREVSHSTHVKRKQTALLYEIRAYLEENFQQNSSLDFLAEKFYINKFHLSRLFKEEFGESIHNFIIQQRITRAKHLLRFTDLSIDEISIQCGVEDANYFSRNFRKIEGISPSSFREKWRM